ncbi:outer membrane beta-barrel domain-containing protein [Gilvimarinus sp. F26214L]|uniref:outer membrane beta-barrel domain-containing protein n=1 Tax=Gilvimarinus sp. DZF01 TaxID=3461371 RepID=UPI00404557AB
MTSKASFHIVATLLGLAAAGSVLAQEQGNESQVRILEPEPPRGVKLAAIDDERFELGLYAGTLSVEDFGTDAMAGIELSYHLLPDWMVQVNYGKASVDRAAFETSQRQFLASDDRDFESIAVTGAYRIVNGRSFFGSSNRFNSDIYVMLGPDRVSFAGNDEWGWTFGLSYRLVFTDWMTANVDFREHLFERDFLGDNKQTLNTEFRIGINALF